MSDLVPSVQTFLGLVSTGEDPALASMARQLAALMADPRTKPADSRPVNMTRRQAVVVAVNLGPPLTADVELDGTTIPGASPQSTYRPVVGDQVWLEFHGADAHISPPLTTNDNFRWNSTVMFGSWTTFGVWNVPLAYHRDAAGFVHLRGSVAGGADGTPITALPAGYRPATVQSGHNITTFPTSTTWEAALVAIDGSTGNIVYRGAGAPYHVPLDGITFRTA